MNRLLALCLVFCVTSIYGQSSIPSVLPCSDGFVKIRHLCYYFSVEAETFDGAEFKCREKKSHLAVINNKRQDRELKAYLTKQYAGAHGNFARPQEPLASVPRWLGGQYNWIKKHWVWRLNGKQMKYQSFSKNQSSFFDWSCSLIHPTYDYNWIGSKCWEKQYYICQTNLQHPPINNSTGKNQPGYYIVTAAPPKKNKRRIICPNNFHAVGRKCYQFSPERDTWQRAYHNCEDKKSQLAIFRKSGQDKKLKIFAKNSKLFDNFWLGGRYDWNAKSWKWAKNGKKINGQTPQKEEVWSCLTWSSISQNYMAENCLTTQYYLCQANPENAIPRKAKKYTMELRFQLHNTTNPSRN